MIRVFVITVLLAAGRIMALSAESSLPRAEWGAPLINVSHTNGAWTISGRHNTVTLNETNLAMTVQNGSARWATVPSGDRDLLVQANGKSAYFSLAAGKVTVDWKAGTAEIKPPLAGIPNLLPKRRGSG